MFSNYFTMSMLMHKRHNVTQLMYHLVFPTKHRMGVIDVKVEKELREGCYKIEKDYDYEIKFIQIGMENDHVHFFVQASPTYSVTQLVTLIKSILARELKLRCPEVFNKLNGSEFWTSGYFANTVGKFGNQNMIVNYVKLQAERGRSRKDKLVIRQQFHVNPGFTNGGEENAAGQAHAGRKE